MKLFLNIVFKSVFLMLFLGSCNLNTKPQFIKFQGNALGTFYNISYYDTDGRIFQEEIDSIFKDFNATLSIYDKQSLLSKINNNQLRTFADNKWLNDVFITAFDIYQTTLGSFDPTVSPLVNGWGFGFSNADNMTQEKVDSLLSFVGFSKVEFIKDSIIKKDPRITFDFNAIAKGYCADVAADFLQSKGIESYLVEIGGEIVSQGKKDGGSFWRVGIEKPTNNAYEKQNVLQVVKLHNKSLATSGNYRRYYEKNGKRYSHTIDPKTGFPVENNLLSVSVIAEKCILADAYATAFMVMGLEKTLAFTEKNKSLDVLMIYVDDNNELNTIASEGFQKLME